MPPTQQADGSEDVADFLERIRELGDRTKREEGERSKKLEEDILQGRKEREARRAERARSISPIKDSPSSTPSKQAGYSSTAGTPVPTMISRPTSTTVGQEKGKSMDIGSSDQTIPKTLTLNLDSEPFMPSPPIENTLSRSGTLSWQQRPSPKVESRGSTPLLSLDSKTTLNPRGSGTGSPEPSRVDVASALEKKDPSWFRQTADRGIGSAAYRRSQEESVGRVSGHVQLPGMAHRDLGNAQAVPSTKDTLDSLKQGSTSAPTASFISHPKNGSTSPALSAPKFELGTPTSLTVREVQAASSGLATSQSQRNISPERPVSPTKGLGGFVQSAMLKRSDSLNKHKRAGSQVALSLSRSNSVLNHQGSANGSTNDTPNTPTRNSREIVERGRQNEAPVSPSKTLDARRWSPTKQSWLEGAISKTDSPRPKSTSIQNPPLWLSELQKSKESSSSGTDTAKARTDKPASLHSASRISTELPSRAPDTSRASAAESTDILKSSVLDQTASTGKTTEKDSKIVDKISETATEKASDISSNQTTSSKTDISESKPIPPVVKSPKPDNYKSISTVTDTTKPISKFTDPLANKSSLLEQKAKSEVPLRKDFRAGLRSTRDLDQKPTTGEPEFKNVFGKLKKTETKNYVAPDELKDNILRGKTSLSVTAGPRVYQKRDDFKDSILKKKEDMKAGGSSKAKALEPAEAQPVPEAIAKRQKLGTKSTAERETDQSLALTATRQEPSQTRPIHTPGLTISRADTKPLISPKPEAIRKVSLDKAADRVGMTSNTPTSPSRPKHSLTQNEEPKILPLTKKTSAPAQLQTTATSNTFANRFNPGLANILARGPPQIGNNVPAMPRTASPTRIGDDRGASKTSTQATSVQLSHVTKGRAKGPKRRAPGNASAEDTSKASAIVNQPPPALQTKPLTTITPNKSTVPHNIETKKDFPKGMTESASDKSEATPMISAIKPHPNIATKPVAISVLSPPSMQKNGEGTKSSVPDARTFINNSSDSTSAASTVSRSPILIQKSPKLPPTPGDKTKAMSRILSNGTSTDRLRTPVSGGILNDFFDNLSTMQNNTDFDAQALLQSLEANHNETSRTLRKEMYEISSDGRKSPLASRQEYVLFEDKMYLCRHHLETSDGKQNAKVFLWCGDQVPPAAIEDVQIFCRAEARDAGGKLQILSQGKEPTSFLDALGGVIVTRRSDSVPYMLCGRRRTGRVLFDEVQFSAQSLCSGFPFLVVTTGSALYLWKGRGANADEIGCARLTGMDLSPTGEIQEVQEESEPAELHNILDLKRRQASPAYWSYKASLENYSSRLFVIDADAKPRPSSSLSNLAVNIWRRRPSAASMADNSEVTVKEISPFAQSDLSEDKIFVLDTFFEIWIIVGSQTRLKSSSFVLATTFAQDYSMLSVSMQDRPYLPQSRIIFLGAAGLTPASIQTAFRKWDDRLIKQQNSWVPATTYMSMHDALEALDSLK